MAHGRSIWESLGGVLRIGGAMLSPFLRPRRTRWGATDEELRRRYPGDEVVTRPAWAATHAITIHAPAVEVWRWVVQIGQGRGGLYSYERLENLVGCRIRNTERILDEHQRVTVGDSIRLHPDVAMEVVAREVGSFLLLQGNPSGDGENGPEMALITTWLLFLDERDDGATRLISRTRYEHGPGFWNALAGGPWLLEPISFVMERKMLRVIKALVESRGRPQA